MKQAKHIAIIAVFCAILGGFALAHMLLTDAALSKTERRPLAEPPSITADTVFSGEAAEDLEAYLLDHFPARDEFRTAKAMLRLGLFAQSDYNGIYTQDGTIFKLEYPLNEAEVTFAAQKMQTIRETYFSDHKNVYYSIIPDKNYFVAAQNGYPSLDYDALASLVASHAPSLHYIDIMDTLQLSDYYRTDTHWRQEKLLPVADRLVGEMQPGFVGPSLESYTAHTISGFSGVYLGQSALLLPPEDLVYLTNADTDASSVTSLEFEGTRAVYDIAKADSLEPYDVFLSGPQAFLTITNENAETDRELILFRDSFGSSLTPLLLPAYSKITLIDLRYFDSRLIPTYIDTDAENQDVLFLYSTLLLNSGMLLK